MDDTTSFSDNPTENFNRLKANANKRKGKKRMKRSTVVLWLIVLVMSVTAFLSVRVWKWFTGYGIMLFAFVLLFLYWILTERKKRTRIKKVLISFIVVGAGAWFVFTHQSPSPATNVSDRAESIRDSIALLKKKTVTLAAQNAKRQAELDRKALAQQTSDSLNNALCDMKAGFNEQAIIKNELDRRETRLAQWKPAVCTTPLMRVRLSGVGKTTVALSNGAVVQITNRK